MGAEWGPRDPQGAAQKGTGFHNNTPDPGLPTGYRMIHCHASTACTNRANLAENHVAGSFDIERAPIDRGYFPGD